MAAIQPPDSVVWTPSARTNVTLFSTNNVEGREGSTYSWRVMLNYNCNVNTSACMSMPVAYRQYGAKNYTLETPPYAGTLEVVLNVSSYGGIYATSPRVYLPAAGTSPCLCTGERLVTAQFMGSASPSPSPSKGHAVKKAGGSAVDTKSALFIGLVSAFTTLATVGLGLVAVYFAGGFNYIARQLNGETGLNRPLRRPNTGSEPGYTGGTNSNDVAGAGGEPRRIVAATTDVTAAAAASTSAVAARRSAVIPPLDGRDSNSDAAAASAPNRPSPADGKKSPGKTPPSRRV